MFELYQHMVRNSVLCVYLQVWDIRTKANVHTLTGHTNTVATVRCQAAEPQIITGKYIYQTNLTNYNCSVLVF